MANEQLDLLGGTAEPPGMPEGFRYAPDIITASAETTLLAALRDLPFRDFEFQGYTGKRRVVSFGWRYDFNTRTLDRVDDMPAFLLPLREAAATFAGIRADALQHALVTEYGAGAGIGWHKDKAVFGDVVGVPCSPPASSACAARVGRSGSDTPSAPSRARSISCAARHARSGSTASRKSTRSATPSRSATCATTSASVRANGELRTANSELLPARRGNNG
jgi:hypothetical protein